MKMGGIMAKRKRQSIRDSGIRSTVDKTIPIVKRQENGSPLPETTRIDQTYRHLKNDLKWSGITAGIIIVMLVFVYMWLH
jgi:hypothetical protein